MAITGLGPPLSGWSQQRRERVREAGGQTRLGLTGQLAYAGLASMSRWVARLRQELRRSWIGITTSYVVTTGL